MPRHRPQTNSCVTLEKNVEATRKVSSVRRRKLSEGGIGSIRPNVARVEVIGEIKDSHRQAKTIFLVNLEFFRNLRINCKKRGKARLARVSYAYKILFRVAHCERKATARLNDRCNADAMRQGHSSPRNQAVRNVE